MSKAPEPQAVQKLLHSRTTKLPVDKRGSQATSAASTAPSSTTTEVSEDVSNSDSGRKGAKNAEKVLSRYWDERSRKPHEKQRKALITGVISNKYQPEPVVKKIAFGGL